MSNSNGKFKQFLRKNLVYLVIAFCVLAIGLSVTLVLVSESKKNNFVEVPIDKVESPTPDVDTPVIETPTPDVETPVITVITFAMPVVNAESIGEYDELPVFNQTLGQSRVHMAIDFFAPEGTEVYACYAGTVESVTTEYLTGTTITIDHGNGLKTVYNSLAPEVEVSVGQTVTKGQLIGAVAESNLQEFMSGAHLHFAVIEDGEYINPEKYLVFAEK